MKTAKEKLLDTGLFSPWGKQSSWILLKGTYLLYCPSSSANVPTRWYLMSSELLEIASIAFNRKYCFADKFSENLISSSSYNRTYGSYINLDAWEVLERLPEEIRTELIFHIDLLL